MLQFFDCDLGVGRSGLGLPVAASQKEALALMDRYHIQRALVYDRGAVESGVFNRTDDILAFCKGSGRLQPTISIAPPATREGPPPGELIRLILAYGIKGVRVWPNVHRFDFDCFSFGELLAQLEVHRIPVFYHSMAISDHPWEHRPQWRNLREVAQAFPNLPLVAIWTGMLEGRRLFPVLAQCPNVLADLTCVSFQFIETVAEWHGSRRLVLASHHPLQDPGPYTTWVSYSGLPPPAREEIAFKNVARLVEGIR